MVMALERAVDGPPRRRSTRDLARQMSEIKWFLRSQLSEEEAAAMVSAGYRCGCADRQCPRCNDDPEEVDTSPQRGKRAVSEPRFAREVIGRVSLFSRHLYVGVPRELRRLPPDERLVLLLECAAGLSVDEVARRLKVSRWTVNRAREAGLERIARALWNERGGVRFEG